MFGRAYTHSHFVEVVAGSALADKRRCVRCDVPCLVEVVLDLMYDTLSQKQMSRETQILSLLSYPWPMQLGPTRVTHKISST